MSSWKRVLTTDDLDSVTDTNLATSNLTQTSSFRTYTLPSSNSGSSLIFRGDVDGNQENLLRIVADANSTSQENSYVYFSSLRIGSFSLSGTQASNGYSLPQHSSSVGEGEIMVSNNFGSNDGSVSFKTFDEWVGSPFSSSPSGLGSTSMLSQSTPNPSFDSVLVFDSSQGANGVFAHQHLKDFRAPVFLSFGRNDSNAQSGLNIEMRGVNGVPHNIDGSLGFVATRHMTLMAASVNFLKTTSGSGSRRVQIYKNGSLKCVTDYFGSSTAQNETVSGAFTFDPSNASSLKQPENFVPGDVISVSLSRISTISTNRHSVVLEFV